MGCVTVWWGLLFLQVLACCVANSPPSLSGKVVSRVIAKLGKATRLACPVEADHELTQWKKDGQSINPGWDRFKVSRDGNLRIQMTDMGDAGLYTCIATNGFGSITINYTVVVLDEENQMVQEADTQFKQSPNEDLYKEGSAPYFEDIEKMKETMNLVKPTGSTIRFTCKAEGNPIPEVHWLKNSQPHIQGRSHTTLKIQEIAEEDSGSYTCVASNRLGQVNFTYYIQVIDEIRHKPRLIAPHPLNQTVDVGATVSFHCNIESVVTPEVQWLKRVDKLEGIPNITLVKHKEEKFMVLKKNSVNQLQLPDGSYLNKLVIQNVQPKDSGMFVCFATNRKGFTTRHAFLEIRPGSGLDGLSSGGDSLLSQMDGKDSSISLDTNNSSKDSSDDSNLPLLIGLPSCAVLVLILLIVFLMQRNNCCHRSGTNSKMSRPPVPSQERDALSYSSNQQHQQTVNPLLTSKEKLPKTPTPSVDMTCSEFSSVSRAHPNIHYYHQPHMNHAY